jgi:hypothetical protein
MAKKILTPEQAEIKNIKKEANSSRFSGVLAVVLAAVIAIGAVSFGKSTSEDLILQSGGVVQGDESNGNNNSSDDVVIDEETGEIITDSSNSDIGGEDAPTDENAQEEETAPNRELPADPAEWTKAEIVDYYKKACNNSKDVKSIQKMTMRENFTARLDNDAWNFAIDMALPIIRTALKANSTEFDGITGGYNDLVPSDVKSAKAYKDGKDTIIEMTLVEQKDDAYGDTFKGTVGHGISVVGNIAVVADNFPDWEIGFDTAFLELHYKNPVIKVRINEKGVIVNGTWSYVVHITVKDLRIAKVVLEYAEGDVDYLITTGGGF